MQMEIGAPGSGVSLHGGDERCAAVFDGMARGVERDTTQFSCSPEQGSR